ncbi:protein msta [Eurytemora carolleeae]|uniref:protein msta n=1 Tax=Eurytemora carolleeae TaxID=1294199 RepID=UPI000C791B75|nr:protein msta [Eurytemora carolleeae]|eukprot:XP_023323790.1 protein msta-like [Eurytemora affinis]
MADSACWLCKKSGNIACSACSTTACSEFHLAAHYTQIQGQEKKCRPIRVEYREGAGNCLVATADIKPGEVILQEYPAVVAPSLVSATVCLECLRNWQGANLCSKCKFPVCNKECEQGTNHKQECSVLALLPTAPTFKPDERSNPAFALIGVIRFLFLQENPDLADRTSLLMDHVDDIKGSPDLLNMWEGTAVQQLVRELPNSKYTKEDVLRAVGVLHTNSVAGMGRGHALYPTFSLTNHSCICNSRFQIYPDRSILLRAQVSIPKGSEITTQYLTPLIGTMPRRQKIRKNWFFSCICDRCADPTEKGTFLSGIICQSCQDIVLPANPLDYETTWKCMKCSVETTGATVQALMNSLQADLDSTDPADFDALQTKRKNWAKVLHQNHYLFLQLKRNILGCLKMLPEARLEQQNRKRLELQVALAEQNIQVFDVLDPGLTILRGRMIQHCNGPKLQLANMDLKNKKISRLEFLQATARSLNNVKIATSCFEDYQQDPSVGSD